jgi:protease-4
LLVFTAICSFTIIVIGLIMIWLFSDSATDSFEFAEGEKIGVIKIEGVIADVDEALLALKQFREDEAIRAIVLRIDSPGGGVGPSQELYREVRKTVPNKKVVASMGSVAASGGYYVAAAADAIMANPGTITGSIGVIMGFTNFEQLLAKIGLVPIVIKSGEYKDVGSPVRPMTSDDRALLQKLTQQIHQQFTDDVAKGRQMPIEQVAALADGRIYTGAEAQALGLVDRLGNLEDAIEWAGRMAGVEGPLQPVYPPEDKWSLLRIVTTSLSQVIGDRFLYPQLKAEYRYTPSAHSKMDTSP